MPDGHTFSPESSARGQLLALNLDEDQVVAFPQRTMIFVGDRNHTGGVTFESGARSLHRVGQGEAEALWREKMSAIIKTHSYWTVVGISEDSTLHIYILTQLLRTYRGGRKNSTEQAGMFGHA